MARAQGMDRGSRQAIAIAWLITAAYYFYQYVMRSAPAVMMPELGAAFGLPAAGLATLIGLFYYGYAPFSLVAGVAMDQIGPRKVVPIGAALVGIGAFLFATGNPALAAVGRFVQGAGGVFALIGAAYIATTYFPASRAATLIGATQMFGMAGGSAGQFLVGPAIAGGLPWDRFWIGMGLAGLAIGLLLLAFIPRPDPGARPRRAGGISASLRALGMVFANPQSILCGLISGLVFIPTTIFDMVWGVRFLQEAHDIPYGMAVLRSAAVPFGWIIGCPLLGYASDRMGRRKPVIIGAALALLACLALILYGPPDLLPPFSFGLVAGIASGAAMLPYTVIKEANRPEHAGTATGVVNFINFSFSALLGPMFAYLLTRASEGGERELAHYQQAFSPLLLGVGLAILLTFFLKETGPAARPAAAPKAQARPASPEASMASETLETPKAAEASVPPFVDGLWSREIDVRDFIQQNVTPYHGDEGFLTGPTDRTKGVWEVLTRLFVEERKKGVLDISQIPSSITAHAPGYIDRDNEIIVGLQTDAPLKRAIMPNGGFRMVLSSLKTYGYEPDPAMVEAFSKYRKTHNDGVFDAYSADIRKCRKSHILTGLPDAYGRGRIIGDYRRVALYGVDRLIAHKKQERAALDDAWPTDDIIRDREELAEQVRALEETRQMAAAYGFDISGPATTAREAVQWLYFAYLAGVKEQNGAAMSLGRVSTFLDIYFERDLSAGLINESQVQEIIDDFVIKLRIVRFLRTPEYDDLFSGDPTWVTESIGGLGDDGRPLVTRTSFRFLHTLYNLGPAPEPNLTIWYSPRLPEAFRRFTAKVAIDTSSIQFESDEIMRREWGDDGAIACCVSPMRLGRQMQFFGARANLAKCLLYAINGGRDEVSGDQVAPPFEPVATDYLDFGDVLARYERMMDWLAGVYVSAMNVIHYMHDKYAYERLEMALHDYAPLRTMAFGIAGMSVVADSLSAIKHARVKVIRDERGLAVDYEIEGDFPKFGNNDNRVDHLAAWLVSTFMAKLRKHPTYRNAVHTQSVLTITSNVVYGRNTGNTPDGRRMGEPFAPGANPMHGRDSHGIHASAASVEKIPYRDAADGISLTTSLVPTGLGRTRTEQIDNLTAILDAFFGVTGYHMNVNVLNRETLLDAMDHPEKYPSLTIRVSGYAVNFVRLTREQQMDVISRTFHGG